MWDIAPINCEACGVFRVTSFAREALAKIDNGRSRRDALENAKRRASRGKFPTIITADIF